MRCPSLKSPTRLDTSLLDFELRDTLVQCESVVVHSSGYGEARRAIQESDTLCSSHRSCASCPVPIDKSRSESTCCNGQPADHTVPTQEGSTITLVFSVSGATGNTLYQFRFSVRDPASITHQSVLQY